MTVASNLIAFKAMAMGMVDVYEVIGMGDYWIKMDVDQMKRTIVRESLAFRRCVKTNEEGLTYKWGSTRFL